jgi:hypothetical protein
VTISDQSAGLEERLRRAAAPADLDRDLLDEPSLFDGLQLEEPSGPLAVADIPVELRHEVQSDAVRETFCRLQASLRALLAASLPGAQPGSVAECLQLFYNCRHALEQEIFLSPDAYAGAVRDYSIEFERGYVVHGRCEIGEPVRILVPCWRLHGEVVVRGEAEPMTPTPLPPRSLAELLDSEEADGQASTVASDV